MTIATNSQKLFNEYYKRFGPSAPSCNFYYDPRFGWMWDYRSPQLIGNNFDEALERVQTSKAMETIIGAKS